VGIMRKIPKLPSYVHSLGSRLMDEGADPREIVDLIRQDPSLVADVLKTVNSSYYGMQNKVSDINSAVLLLGFQELYHLVMSEGLRRAMPDTSDFRELHSQAVVISYFAFSLSISAKRGIPVQMATIGLLHNLGKTVIGLIKQKNPNLSVFMDALDHPSLGAFLLEEWNLPSKICKTVKYQRFPEFADPAEAPRDVVNEVAVLYMARLCHDAIRGISRKDMPIAFFQEYQNVLGWGELTLEEILNRRILSELRKNAERLPLSVKKLLS
jgi:HD-like signal output (HDOD) protein